MGKIALSLFVLLISVVSFSAIKFEVVGPCFKEPIFSTNKNFPNGKTIGALTVAILNESNLAYSGDESKINSIDNTPTGDTALEVISNSEMRAYGWCYYVNNIQPAVYPNEVKTSDNIKSVKWLFGYAHYLDGKWVSMCEPSWKIKPAFICDKK